MPGPPWDFDLVWVEMKHSVCQSFPADYDVQSGLRTTVPKAVFLFCSTGPMSGLLEFGLLISAKGPGIKVWLLLHGAVGRQ